MNGNLIFDQFDEIEEKVEFLIELCKSLDASNKELQAKVEGLELQIKDKTEAEELHSDHREKIRNKIDGLMGKLNGYSELC